MLLGLSLLLTASADDTACHLIDSDNSDDVLIVLDHLDSTCKVEVDGLAVTVESSEDVKTCQVKDGGDNIIVIWPRTATQRACFVDGAVDSVGIVMIDNL